MRLKRVLLAAGTAIFCLSAPAAALQEESDPAPARAEPNALVIFAHPDDELTIAPLLARITRSGGQVTIVYATSGDQGPGVSGMEKGDALAKVREGEARCAADALGAGDPVFLRLGDGTLANNAHFPDSAASKLLVKIRGLVADHTPDVILTWGPDGGYGHPDHRMVSALVTQHVQMMQENRPALFYPAIRNGTLPPVPELQRWATTAPDLVSTHVDYTAEDLSAAAKALDCHRTQFDEETRKGLIPLFDQSVWQGEIHLKHGYPKPVVPPEEAED